MPKKKKVYRTPLKQTGTSNKRVDSARKAKKPGRRHSASGRPYYERRANRSDVGKYL